MLLIISRNKLPREFSHLKRITLITKVKMTKKRNSTNKMMSRNTKIKSKITNRMKSIHRSKILMLKSVSFVLRKIQISNKLITTTCICGKSVKYLLYVPFANKSFLFANSKNIYSMSVLRMLK